MANGIIKHTHVDSISPLFLRRKLYFEIQGSHNIYTTYGITGEEFLSLKPTYYEPICIGSITTATPNFGICAINPMANSTGRALTLKCLKTYTLGAGESYMDGEFTILYARKELIDDQL